MEISSGTDYERIDSAKYSSRLRFSVAYPHILCLTKDTLLVRRDGELSLQFGADCIL